MSKDVVKQTQTVIATEAQPKLHASESEIASVIRYLEEQFGWAINAMLCGDGTVVLTNEFGDDVAEIRPDGTVCMCETGEDYHVDDFGDPVCEEETCPPEDDSIPFFTSDELDEEVPFWKPEESQPKGITDDASDYTSKLTDPDPIENIEVSDEVEEIEIDESSNDTPDVESASEETGLASGSEGQPPSTEPEGAISNGGLPPPVVPAGPVHATGMSPTDVMKPSEAIPSTQIAAKASTIASNSPDEDTKSFSKAVAEIFTAGAQNVFEEFVSGHDGVVPELTIIASAPKFTGSDAKVFDDGREVEVSVVSADGKSAAAEKASSKKKKAESSPHPATSHSVKFAKSSNPFAAGAEAMYDSPFDIACAQANKGGPPYFFGQFSSSIAAVVNPSDIDSNDHVASAHSSEGHEQPDREGSDRDDGDSSDQDNDSEDDVA